MQSVDPKSFEFSLSKISDGFIFENFINEFLSQILGYDFIPVGGIKDRGIDGLEHVFNQKGYDSFIYQTSIVKDSNSKIKNSLKKLKDNQIKVEKFIFVTNQEVKNQDLLVDELFKEYKIPIYIYDIKWLASRVNHSPGTISIYERFTRDHLHEYEQPGKAYSVNGYVSDPRLFVFLRQQWDINRGNLDLHSILADTLILYCLEGTDPDKNIFKTKDELESSMTKLIDFDFKILKPIINQRLKALSTKPRKIKYHSAAKAYCLPYKTRLEICDRNLQDSLLYEQFKKQTEDDFNSFISDSGSEIEDGFILIEKTLNQIFYQQGLEFSNFITNIDSKDIYEKDLSEIIDTVVEKFPKTFKFKNRVKEVILLTIRKMVYSGTPEQNQFLMKLSHTYMMMFMLQCDPKICTYFQEVASKLNVYVCTSIIIPALSEYYLPEYNRRHWNLLIGARNAGVTLIINEPILSELASHFKSIVRKYKELYEGVEDVYLSDEEKIRYIDEIMIRAYFYAKYQGHIKSFENFINTFVSPNLKNTDIEIREWLKKQFNISFKSDASLGINLDDEEFSLLYDSLKKQKSVDAKAKTDTSIILTVHKLREKNNETGSSGIFGYKTWWLSKDTVTQKVVNRVFKHKYKISCYMRTDFLYNYISLAPTKSQIDSAYIQLFPTMLGVNISYHINPKVIGTVNKLILEHKDTNHPRLASILHVLTEKLKTEPNKVNRKSIKDLFKTETLKG